MVIALVIVFILFCGLTNGRLLYAQNMSNLMLQNGYVLVLACGMLLCILTGGNIDLSVGALMACASTYCALLISNGLHPAGALLVGVLIATVFGAINGGIVANTKIPPSVTNVFLHSSQRLLVCSSSVDLAV